MLAGQSAPKTEAEPDGKNLPEQGRDALPLGALPLRAAKRSNLEEDVAHLEQRLAALDAKEAERPANRLKKLTDELNEVTTMIGRLEALSVDTTALVARKAELESEK
eukprot:gene5322-21562_t